MNPLLVVIFVMLSFCAGFMFAIFWMARKGYGDPLTVDRVHGFQFRVITIH